MERKGWVLVSSVEVDRRTMPGDLGMDARADLGGRECDVAGVTPGVDRGDYDRSSRGAQWRVET